MPETASPAQTKRACASVEPVHNGFAETVWEEVVEEDMKLCDHPDVGPGRSIAGDQGFDAELPGVRHVDHTRSDGELRGRADRRVDWRRPGEFDNRKQAVDKF